jgi:hypothetical protein
LGHWIIIIIIIIIIITVINAGKDHNIKTVNETAEHVAKFT